MSAISQQLEQNVAAIDLAVAIYQARGRYFGIHTAEFGELPSRAKDRYILRAVELLKTLAPEPITVRVQIMTGLRTPTSNVVGAIHPEGD